MVREDENGERCERRDVRRVVGGDILLKDVFGQRVR